MFLDRTLRNWRWWAAIVPMGVVGLPFVAVDLSLAAIGWAADTVVKTVGDTRAEGAYWWRKATRPARRWAYERVRLVAEGGGDGGS